MRRNFIVAVVVVTCVVLAGCKKDAEIESITAELHSFSEELTKKVQSAQNPSAGVDEAQKLMDSRKADLQSKMKSIKEVRGYQVSKETQQKMTSTLSKDAMSVAGLQMKYISVSMRDPAFKGKLDKLIRDYTEIFKI
jgi:outer membrane murein-binding lipoprotein Lpp